MTMHTPLYRELYKYTNHSKQIESKKEIARFTFTEPSRERDGLNFIDSTCLHSVDSQEIKNSRVYFENISSPKSRYMNKNIRICNVPFSELPLKGDVLKALNQYLIKNIKYDSNGGAWVCPNIESLGLRRSNWNNNYPDLEYIYKVGTGIAFQKNRESISRFIYGLQFNSLEFFEATGILITLYRSCKQRKKNSPDDTRFTYKSGKLSNFKELVDGKNIRISIPSNAFLEIDFNDEIAADDISYELYDFEYEIDIMTCVSELYNGINYKENTITWLYQDEEDTGVPANLVGQNIDSGFTYNVAAESMVFKDNCRLNFIQIEDYIDKTSHEFKFATDIQPYKNLLYVTGTHDYNQIMLTNSTRSINYFSTFFMNPSTYELIKPNEKLNEYNLVFNADIFPMDNKETPEKDGYLLNSAVTGNSLLTTFQIVQVELKDMNSKRMTELHDIIDEEPFYIPDNTDLISDEKNLIKCLPYSLKDILEEKATFNINKITEIPVRTISMYNGIPCIKYTIDSKHDSIMFFKDNKLLSPSFIEEIDDTYSIYIELSLLVNMTDEVLRIVYGKNTTTKTVQIKNDVDFYIVYDTDKLFIENMRYGVKSIYKYLDANTTTRYSVRSKQDEDNPEFMIMYYAEDEDGDYIFYNNYYLEIASGLYYLSGNQYVDSKPSGYTGKTYLKVKTNEYLLPLNKDIDPNKIVIAIEDSVDFEGNETKFRRDIDGVYIRLTEPRYYTCYNFKYSTTSTAYYKLMDGKYITVQEYNNSLSPTGSETSYHKENNTIYYLDYTNYYSTEDVFIKVDGEYYPFNEYTLVDENDNLIEIINNTTYTGRFYLEYGPGYVIPPYYYEDDVHYTKVGKKLVQLANLFNIRKFENVVAIDSYVNMEDEQGNTIIVENKTYSKKELVKTILSRKYKINIDDDTRYYKDDETYKVYDSGLKNIQDRTLYCKTLEDTYVLSSKVDSLKAEINQFIDLNRVYKFSLVNGEVLDGGLADTDEYIQYIDFGKELSFTDYPSLNTAEVADLLNNGEIVYINQYDKLVEYDPEIHSAYDGEFYSAETFEQIGTDLNENVDSQGRLIDEDDYPVYDFNFTSPYSIIDSNIKAYRIDSSYSKYYINQEDDFLAYVIPNQLINSETKMLTFLNGKMTDEYIINKKLYSRLFNGDTILSFSDNPEDTSGNDYVYNIDSDGTYYFDSTTGKYVEDPNRDTDILERVSSNTYYKIDDNNYIESAVYDKNDIVDITLYKKNPDGTYSITPDRTGTYYKLKNGNYIPISQYKKNTITIIDYKKYFELRKEYNGSFFIHTKEFYEYTTKYSKSISSVFMCNMKNMILYQNQNGINYDADTGIFTMGSEIDCIVRNERQIYKDIYFLPLSTKYMLFFINGRFANPEIEIISPTKFYIKNLKKLLDGSTEINQVHVYVFDRFIYGLDKYKDYYFNRIDVPCFDNVTQYDIPGTVDYSIYTYKDTLWDEYSDILISRCADLTDKDIIWNPKDMGFSPLDDLVALYEIFGKYILNKYDIDSDYSLYDEIREYFSALFDEDNRMRLELIQETSKRKYIY